MPMHRRELLASFAAGISVVSLRSLVERIPYRPPSTLHLENGSVDWLAVRALFPLNPDWTHLAAFLFVSHPKPVADSINFFRKKIDSDHVWLELAAFEDSEGRPFRKMKQALGAYTGGKPSELCMTSNTTSALAMFYHGVRIRRDQEILTTEHDHFSHHESIRYAAMRSGCGVRRVALYDKPSQANATEMVDRIARAITPQTRVVGVTWAHSSTGVLIPIAPIAAAVAQANRGRAAADRCLLLVDGVHGFANQDVDIATLGADFFAAGLHKWMLAPRGTGFLWGRTDAWPELRQTIPTFDPDAPEAWDAWMNRSPIPTATASNVSPGGFLAYEHFLAIPAAIELHRSIGRANIAARIAELNGQFREGAAKIPKLTLHTPRDRSLSGGISCFEMKGMTAKQVTDRLAAKRIRTNNSPYKVSLARVSAGVMNSPADIDAVLRELRAM